MSAVFRWIDSRWKYFFLIPTLLFTLGMIVFPILYTVVLSFSETQLAANASLEFVGVKNYVDLFTSREFLSAAGRTFVFAGVSLAFESVIGIGLALLMGGQFRGKNLAKTLMLLPMVATPVAMGLVWKLILDPNIGIANKLLVALGGQPLTWLSHADTVLGSLILMDIWGSVSLIMLIVVAGMAGLPTDVYEAAVVDGANGWKKLWRITMPLLSPTIFVAVLFRLIESLKTFDIIYATTQGGPGMASTTLNLLAYRYAFEYFKFGKSSAVIILFFLIVVGMTFLLLRLRKRIEVEY